MRSATRRDAPVPGAPLRFGFLGRLAAEKGLGSLLEACRLLPKTGWELRIGGKGPEHPAFEAQAEGLPVSFEGYVDATAFLADIDVLVCVPLWDEPFGLTTIEAYAAGCRVIGSDRGVIREVIDRVDPGWTVSAGAPDALAAAMTRAIAEGSPLPDGRRPAVERLLAELDPEVVAQKYLDLYQMVQAPVRVPLTANG